MQFNPCNPSPEILQECCNTVFLQKCFVDCRTSRDFPSIEGGIRLWLHSFFCWAYPFTFSTSFITWSLIYCLRSHLICWLNGHIQHSWKSDKTGRWWVKAGIRKNMRMGAQSTLTSLHLNRSLTTQEVATPTPWSCLEGRKINEWIEEEKRKAELISCILISVQSMILMWARKKRDGVHLPCKCTGRRMRGYGEIWHEPRSLHLWDYLPIVTNKPGWHRLWKMILSSYLK